jgi:hypothetical protein
VYLAKGTWLILLPEESPPSSLASQKVYKGLLLVRKVSRHPAMHLDTTRVEIDFTTAEGVHLKRVAVPCDSDSASHSLPQAPVPSLDPLPSVITHNDYTVIPPTTYSKTMVHSIVTPIPIRVDGPSTSFQMSAVQPPPSAANSFAVKETSPPLSSVNTVTYC